MDRPRPLPPALRVLELSTWEKGLNRRSSLYQFFLLGRDRLAHAIQRRCEAPDLVLALALQLRAEVAVPHALGGIGQPACAPADEQVEDGADQDGEKSEPQGDDADNRPSLALHCFPLRRDACIQFDARERAVA